MTTTTSSTPLSHLDDMPLVQPSAVTPLKGDGSGDPFWGDDPSVLFQKDRLVEFFPTADQTLPERLNSISRLVVYIGIALTVYQGKATAIHFGILLLGMLYVMYKNQTIIKLKENIQLEQFSDCRMPTQQNPYMNFLIGDTPGATRACKGPGLQETAANLLDRQLFSDVDDLYTRNANQRLFRTMPDTTGIPDRENYANWLIKGEEGCRTTGQCLPYEDLKFQRQIIPEDLDQGFSPEGFSL
jgi:Family of unknown function (DUF5762)